MLKSIKVATLNARTINKISNPKASRNYHKFLSTQRIGILALQETNINPHDNNTIRHLNSSLRSHTSIWTPDCALLLIHSRLTFLSSSISRDGRAIFAKIGSVDTADKLLFEVCVIYAPSGNPTARTTFFSNLLQEPFFDKPGPDVIVMGDFNYHHHMRNSAPALWKSWLNNHTINTLNPLNTLPIHTFNNHRNQTTIDYIFMSPGLAESVTAPTHTYLHNDWTDHAMLSCELQLEALATGPGVWRLNTSILRDKEYTEQLTNTIKQDLRHMQALSPQDAWDQLKEILMAELQQATRAKSKEKEDISVQLQRDREQALRRLKWQQGAPDPNPEKIRLLEEQWHKLERRLDKLQEASMNAWAVRTQLKWREFGERCTKYFFRVLNARAAKRTITELRAPDSADTVSSPKDLCRVGRSFYQKLYTPDPTDHEAVDELLSNLPALATISQEDQDGLMRPIDTEEIEEALSSSARGKAPGLDGFPFELYTFLLSIEEVASLLSRVMSQALQDAMMPRSWQQTCMILLYKKGDAADLGNWRPLSLINSDAKLFTKIITIRLRVPLDQLITPLQTGFVSGRNISDNGLVMAAFREHCEKHKVEGIGILFDQEKAYDRVHPDYLRAVMEKMRFPGPLIDSIFTLFFDTQIHLNINGHLAPPFPQRRGLRQGDPLSPHLYNIAFEPLLHTILKSPGISGFRLNDHPRTRPLKLMAYADDLTTFIKSAEEWSCLKEIMDLFGRASNARLNLKKTVAFPLYRSVGALSQALQQDHVVIHSDRAEEALTYLGYPLALSSAQRDSFFNNIHTKIKHHINLHHGRQLSILGRSTIANSLLLSRLWHVIAVHPPTRQWIKKVQGSIRKFTVPFNPAPSWDYLCLRRSQGGLGLVDITSQSVAFQLRTVQKICSDTHSFMVPLFKDLLCSATGSEFPLAPFASPGFFLTPRFGHFRSLSVLKGLVTAVKHIPSLTWEQETAESLPVGTMMATLLPLWLKADGVPEPHPPNWRMDRVFRPVWTDEAKTEGTLAFIPLLERVNRSRPGLENNQRHGRFKAHPALQRALDTPGPLTLEDDLAERINKIVITQSENGSFELASTRTFRQTVFSKFYQPPTPPPHHPPMIAPPPPLTSSFWTLFWKNPIPHNARNVWWRLLINKLPSGVHFHSILPDKVGVLCRICLTQVESNQHLLFSCPKKLEVWQSAMTRYVEERDWSADYVCSLFFPKSDPLEPHNDVPLFLLIGVILATIWRYHFAFVMEDQGFDPRIVLTAVDLAITQARAQLAEKKRQSEERQPPPPVEPPPTDTNHPT